MRKPANQRRMTEKHVQRLHRAHNTRFRKHEKIPTSRTSIRKQARAHWRGLPEPIRKEHRETLEAKGMTDPDAIALMALVGAE